MLSLQQTKPHHHGICKPNVLPCRINHNGPINTSKRYWNPSTPNPDDNKSTTTTSTAYFRGRRLEGRSVKIPEGYKGVVVVDSKKALGLLKSDDVADAGVGEEEEEEVGILEEYAEFGEFVVWGHECEVEGAGDEYVRGVEEWIGFAETANEYSKESVEEGDKEGKRGS